MNKESTLFPGLFKHCDLKKPELKYEISEKNENFEIKIKTDYPAFFVSFDSEGVQGQFSENMFTLLPFESKIITFIPKEKIGINDFKKSLLLYDLRYTY